MFAKNDIFAFEICTLNKENCKTNVHSSELIKIKVIGVQTINAARNIKLVISEAIWDASVPITALRLIVHYLGN